MRGNQMNGIIYVGVVMFFVGIVFAVGGIYFGVKAYDNDYARLRVENHEVRGEMKISKEAFEKTNEELEEKLADISEMRIRLDALERRSTSINANLVMPPQPLEVNVVHTHPAPRIPAQKPALNSKTKARMNQ